MVRLTAPTGKKLRHIPTERLYSEVICTERETDKYVVADSDEDPTTAVIIDGTTLADRVTDLEDAIVELAEIITEGGE